MKMRRHKYVGHPGDRPLDAEARAASDYFDMTEDENEDSDPTDNGDIHTCTQTVETLNGPEDPNCL